MSRAALEEAENVARRVGKLIGRAMPPGWGFVFTLFSLGEGGFVTYIANVQREDAVKGLRELLDKIERNAEEA